MHMRLMHSIVITADNSVLIKQEQFEDLLVTGSCISVKEEICDDPSEMSMFSDPVNETPSVKRRRSDVMISIPNIGSLRWVHKRMKPDLEAAFKTSEEEFKNCCNWWYCLIMWKKKDVTKEDRNHFAQGGFGTLPSQLNFNDDSGSGTNLKMNEPIAVRIIRQWSSYKKYIFRRLREHFEALLLMFLESPETRPIVDAMLVQVKNRGVGSIGLTSPCVSPREISLHFVKNEVRLVSDVWYPLMHVVKADFLLNKGIWGQRWLDATCVVLSWLLTHFFRLENCEELTRFKCGKCPIAADLFSSAICKADGVMPIEWPTPLNIPVSWTQRRIPSYSYGALKFINITRGSAEGLVDDEIDSRFKDPDSGISKPPPLANVNLLEILQLTTVSDQVDYMLELLRSCVQALRMIEKDARENAELMEQKCEVAMAVIKDHKMAMEKGTNDMQRRWLVDRFVTEAKTMFLESEQQEKDAASFKGRRGPGFNTTEILGGFAWFMGMLNRDEYFKEFVRGFGNSSYEMGGNMGMRQNQLMQNQWGGRGNYSLGNDFGGGYEARGGFVNPPFTNRSGHGAEMSAFNNPGGFSRINYGYRYPDQSQSQMNMGGTNFGAGMQEQNEFGVYNNDYPMGDCSGQSSSHQGSSVNNNVASIRMHGTIRNPRIQDNTGMQDGMGNNVMQSNIGSSGMQGGIATNNYSQHGQAYNAMGNAQQGGGGGGVGQGLEHHQGYGRRTLIQGLDQYQGYGRGGPTQGPEHHQGYGRRGASSEGMMSPERRGSMGQTMSPPGNERRGSMGAGGRTMSPPGNEGGQPRVGGVQDNGGPNRMVPKDGISANPVGSMAPPPILRALGNSPSTADEVGGGGDTGGVITPNDDSSSDKTI